MPTVEDYFDDDTELPLPSSSSRVRNLPNTGVRGALLEEVDSEDEVDTEMSMDYSKLAEQSRGIFGEDSIAPPQAQTRSSGSGDVKGKMSVRDQPAAGGSNTNTNTPMAGFMGDMLKLQQAEDERMERLRKQFGSATLAKDPSVYKGWNTVYPLYFDAKVSINDGRRVPRKSALWWPQAGQIANACRTLGLPSVLEPDKTHPADWENPGRVKVEFRRDGRFINPIVKTRAQLMKHLSDQMRQQNPSLMYKPSSSSKSKSTTSKPNSSTKSTSQAKLSKSKPQSKLKTAITTNKLPSSIRPPTRPPSVPQPIPKLDSRLPLHSPSIPTGVAVSAMKRDLESEKEQKKKGLSIGGGDGEGKEKEKEKMPKMKRVVVRGKR